MKYRNIIWDMMAGRIPYSEDLRHLRAHIEEAVQGSGRVVIAFDGRDFPVHVLGHVCGGTICGMLDLTAGFAPATTYGPNEYGPTLELKVNFMRPAKAGKFVGIGRTMRRTKSIAFAEAELKNESGKLVATASTTVRLIRRERPV